MGRKEATMTPGNHKGQQAILDATSEYGYVKCHTDWRSGRRFITTGRGHTFDARSFDALVRKGLLVADSDSARTPTLGVKYVARNAANRDPKP
jgi:hypothetical protein